MKTYIGTKKIEAEPMTRGEYAKYSNRNSILTEKGENYNDEGYFVKYPDGYISWSPKQQFEEAYREVEKYPLGETALLDDFKKERFIAEYNQLIHRRDGLERMLVLYTNGTLNFKPNCSYDLLHSQLVYMNGYIDILKKRASIENIEL